MPAKVFSAATLGLSGELVEVEVDVLAAGLHHFTLVGLPDTAIKESRERVSAALKNSGFKPPHQCGRVTVNLAPADLPKNSPIYDFPMALGFLLTTGQLHFQHTDKLFVGELSLNGEVRPVSGILPIALFAKERGFTEFYVPAGNAQEAALVPGLTIFAVHNLIEVAESLSGLKPLSPFPPIDPELQFQAEPHTALDMLHVKGQAHAKRALEIAAAGGHNILLSGPPGSGKTLLAQAFTSILPRLSFAESLEITQIYSVAGKLTKGESLITVRPMRAPHHTASSVSLIGGGSLPRPGEISLAHRGVLFLDEFPEFNKPSIESLRQPLEDGAITVARAKGTLRFPARFILVAAMNPCPCGNLGDPERLCTCTSRQILNYQRKISGPILDRIDLHIEVPRQKLKTLDEVSTGETSKSIRARVEQARGRQRARFDALPFLTNNEMSSQHLEEFCALDAASKQLFHQSIARFHLSARSYHRLIKVARTIADLANNDHIEPHHVAEAIQYRFRAE